jgi:hypothetical protein
LLYASFRNLTDIKSKLITIIDFPYNRPDIRFKPAWYITAVLRHHKNAFARQTGRFKPAGKEISGSRQLLHAYILRHELNLPEAKPLRVLSVLVARLREDLLVWQQTDGAAG